jgi:hypothetical protein
MKGKNDKTLYEFYIDSVTGETSFEVDLNATKALPRNKQLVLLTSLETIIDRVKKMVDGEIPDLAAREPTVTIKKGAVSFEAEIKSQQIIELRHDQINALLMTLNDVTSSVTKLYTEANLKNKPFSKN